MAAVHLQPIAVRDTTAAGLLDMPVSEFRRLVNCGALPPPVTVAQHERWIVGQIEAILSGRADLPTEEFEL
ncbi:hypothetical protein [Antarcticimicrobium luteum]|uniref:Uncharacterized protein n=1 Tax=Antarcticimicrobium luteum TaxID=2547397 RepID=A0A4V3ASK1_9RHOB|nr:hypothetical protein [Antarcticimicrobium luteum]TDK50831.1 hypothetical protein E1832_05465 [Antarcticimicrobium luteum]